MWEQNWKLKEEQWKEELQRREEKNAWKNECKNGCILQQLIEERCRSS